MAIAESLLTAEEFFELPDDGRLSELVRGRIVTMNMPGFRHGKICSRIGRILGNNVDEHELGHVLCNDSGVVTERGPDTVCGPDVAFYSYARVPKDCEPVGYPAAAPELVFEVRSPSDGWPELLAKAGEYLKGGVNMVCIVDAATQTVVVHDAEGPGRTLVGGDELAFPDWLGRWRLPVERLFS